jgi:Zn-finger nucleic acid-binding protein
MSSKRLSKEDLKKLVKEGWFSEPAKILCPRCSVLTEPGDGNMVHCKGCEKNYLIGPEADKIRQQYGIKKTKEVGHGGGWEDTVFNPIISLMGGGYKSDGEFEVAVDPDAPAQIEAHREYRAGVEARKKAREEKRAAKEAEQARKKQDPRYIALQAKKAAIAKKKADLERSYETDPVTETSVVSESQLRAFIRETLETVMQEMEIEYMPDGSVWTDEGELTGSRPRRSGPMPGTDAYLAPPKPKAERQGPAYPNLADLYATDEPKEEMPGSVLEPEDPNQLSLDFDGERPLQK